MTDPSGKFYMGTNKLQIAETQKSIVCLHVTAWIFGGMYL